MNKWFGPIPFSHACASTPQAPTPDANCAWCDEGFAPEDCGYLIPHIGDTVTELAYHAECWQRQLLGSVAHIEGACSCYGGADEGDPPHLTKREAAQAAVVAFRAHRTDEGL